MVIFAGVSMSLLCDAGSAVWGGSITWAHDAAVQRLTGAGARQARWTGWQQTVWTWDEPVECCYTMLVLPPCRTGSEVVFDTAMSE